MSLLFPPLWSTFVMLDNSSVTSEISKLYTMLLTLITHRSLLNSSVWPCFFIKEVW